MPSTSLPPTRGTRSGIPACGADGGSGTGDTSLRTPGPRSGDPRDQGAGRLQACGGEGRVDPCAQPGAWPLTPSGAECCDPMSLPLGGGRSGNRARLWPRTAQQGIALVSGLPCPRLRLDPGTSSSSPSTPPRAGATQALIFFQ